MSANPCKHEEPCGDGIQTWCNKHQQLLAGPTCDKCSDYEPANPKSLEEILKSYHCWHTPLDCQGCDKDEICKKETSKTVDEIRQLLTERLRGLKKDVSQQFVSDLVYRPPLRDGEIINKTYINYDQRIGWNEAIEAAIKEIENA